MDYDPARRYAYSSLFRCVYDRPNPPRLRILYAAHGNRAAFVDAVLRYGLELEA